MVQSQRHGVLPGQTDQPSCTCGTLGQRFFGINVLSGQEGGFVDGLMQKMGRTVMDDLNVRVSDHLPPVGIYFFHMIALCGGMGRVLVRVADCGEFCVRRTADRVYMLGPDEAQSDDTCVDKIHPHPSRLKK